MGIMRDTQKTGAPERKVENVLRRAAKCGEETGELLEAVLSVTSVSGAKGKKWMDVVEEACDIVIMGLDVALTKPPEWEDVDDAMWRAIVKKIIDVKLAKWKHQLRKGQTITAEGKLPKFTDEEHEAFLGLVAEMRAREPLSLSEAERRAIRAADAAIEDSPMHQPEGDDAVVEYQYRGRGDITEHAQEFCENARRSEALRYAEQEGGELDGREAIERVKERVDVPAFEAPEAASDKFRERVVDDLRRTRVIADEPRREDEPDEWDMTGRIRRKRTPGD